MKIIVTGPAEAFSSETEEEIVDPVLLQELDGLAYSKDRCSKYIDESLQDIGVTGGVIQLAFDAKKKRLRVVTEYQAPRKLTAAELKLLVEETTGQWSDGIGEGDFLHRKKLKMAVDLSPESSEKVRVEQVEDGKKVKTPLVDPLIKALDNNNSKAAGKLIAEGVDVTGIDRDGHSALQLACQAGFFDLALLMLQRGASATAADKQGETPLTWLARYPGTNHAESVAVARALIEKGSAVDARDNERGMTPLMWAISRGNLPLIQFLIDAGADVNAKDRMKDNEKTAVMYAKTCDAAELLLRNGADPSVCNASGETAWDNALLNDHIRGYRQLAELLRSHAKRAERPKKT